MKEKSELTDPSGAAGREHGHRLGVVGVALEVLRQAVQQLSALLHDGQVGGKQRICTWRARGRVFRGQGSGIS